MTADARPATAATAATPRRRILVVAPGFMLGGQARAAADIVRGFAGDGDFALELQPIDPRLEGPWRVLTELAGVRSLVRPLLLARALRRRVPQVDAVHVFCAAHTAFFFGAVPAVRAARRHARPAILNYHDGRAAAHYRWWGTVVRWAIRRSAVLVVPSPFLQRLFGGHGHRAEVVPNVVDTSAFRYRRPEPVRPRLLSARLLEPLYAVDNTLRAFARVRDAVPEVRLDVYGPGRSRPALERLAARLGDRGIAFHGAVPHAQMPAVFEQGGILVNSSRVDNMPHVLIEAMAAGLPIVTTAAGGIPDIVEDGRTALLVPVDDPAALAAAVLRVLRESGLAVRLAAAGREASASYGWDRAHAGWRRIYDGVTGAAASGWAGPHGHAAARASQERP